MNDHAVSGFSTKLLYKDYFCENSSNLQQFDSLFIEHVEQFATKW